MEGAPNDHPHRPEIIDLPQAGPIGLELHLPLGGVAAGVTPGTQVEARQRPSESDLAPLDGRGVQAGRCLCVKLEWGGEA